MGVQYWTYIIVGVTFAIYIGIAIWSRAGSTKDFFVAGGNISPLANGMATGADWMSAASFLGMAGLIAFAGYDGSAYLMGWTGGYVLLALLMAPYLRKFGKFTVPDFIGDRYYSKNARLIALLCAIFISFTYVAGQMRGVGIVFSRFLDVGINTGVVIGMIIVFFYAVLGGMKGITYTQVAQYCVLIFAFTVPAIFISLQMTGNPVPQVGMGGELVNEPGTFLLDKLDLISKDLGFGAYTEAQKPAIDTFCLTAALMLGTAGLPHVIVRFFTVKRIRDARSSAAYALIFIAILYTTAPAIAAFSKTNFIDQIAGTNYTESPEWFKKWEDNDLIAWVDKNGDGVINYVHGNPFSQAGEKPEYSNNRGAYGQRLVLNEYGSSSNEVFVDKDIMVLANPEIAGLPDWVIALVAAGALAAALSTAAGLLLVISSSVAHDLIKKQINPDISEKKELLWARIAAGGAVIIAGYFGINPPGFVAEVVAFAFGLAASTFFPAIIMGIFSKRMNRQGAMAGMLAGLLFTTAYIIYFKFLFPEINNEEHWLFGISPKGIGTVGMILNFVVAFAISKFTPPPPAEVVKIVEDIRIPASRESSK